MARTCFRLVGFRVLGMLVSYHWLFIPGKHKQSRLCAVCRKKWRGSSCPGCSVITSGDSGSRTLTSSLILFLRIKRVARVTTFVILYYIASVMSLCVAGKPRGIRTFPSPSWTVIPMWISVCLVADGRTTSVLLPIASRLCGLLQLESPTLRIARFWRSSLGNENM